MALLPIVDLQSSIGCGCCVLCCPTHALEMVQDKAIVAHPERCDYEGRCEDVCPADAIELTFEIVLAASDEEAVIGSEGG